MLTCSPLQLLPKIVLHERGESCVVPDGQNQLEDDINRRRAPKAVASSMFLSIFSDVMLHPLSTLKCIDFYWASIVRAIKLLLDRLLSDILFNWSLAGKIGWTANEKTKGERADCMMGTSQRMAKEGWERTSIKRQCLLVFLHLPQINTQANHHHHAQLEYRAT